jgi:hypothetical protein
VRDHGGVCLVPVFVRLGAPHWEATARGTIVGLTRSSSAAHARPAQRGRRAPADRSPRRDRPAALVRPAAPGKTHGAGPPHFPPPLRNFASCVPTRDRYGPAHSPP